MSRFDVYILIFICVSILLAFASCGNPESDINTLTEKDFSVNPDLRADPGGVVLKTFLENPGSLPEKNDTGVIGRDIIRVTYASTVSHTFCWNDGDHNAKHLMTMNDINGIEVVRVISNGGCVTEVIEPGDYDIYLHHDGRSDRSMPLLLERQEAEYNKLKTTISSL